MSSTDARAALVKLKVIERSMRYGILLNEQLHLDKNKSVILKGGHAHVWMGLLDIPANPTTMEPQRIKVSIKTPPGGLVNEEAIIKNFLKEAHTWSKLYHENVLPLIGITTEVDYTVSMVSKWQEKGNARDYVQDARIQRISSGLQYMHSHVKGPIAHGDLKGANVLISDEGKALLTDFGLPYMPNSSCSITTSTPKGGTTRWSSPELLDGGNKTPEADVWAFGMTALELFTRTDPYPSCPTTIAVITSIALGKSPERPNEKDTGARLTDEWWNMLNMCWKFKPNDRISIEEIVKAIKILVPSS